MRESEIEYALAVIDFDETLERLQGLFALPLFRRGMTHVRDMYLDTNNFLLYEKNCSFRVRLKLEDIYQGAQIRLTFKLPLEEHPYMLVRDELKLKLMADDFGAVADFFGRASVALTGQNFSYKLIVEETSNEALLGEKGKALNVSFDRVRFISPLNPENVVNETFFEIEDHGIGEDRLLEIGKKLEEIYNLVPCKETKYRRGLRLLGLLGEKG